MITDFGNVVSMDLENMWRCYRTMKKLIKRTKQYWPIDVLLKMEDLLEWQREIIDDHFANDGND